MAQDHIAYDIRTAYGAFMLSYMGDVLENEFGPEAGKGAEWVVKFFARQISKHVIVTKQDVAFAKHITWCMVNTTTETILRKVKEYGFRDTPDLRHFLIIFQNEITECSRN